MLGMPEFVIRTVNSTFNTLADHQSFASAEHAMRFGVSGALAIASDEVLRGSPSTAVEVIVEDDDRHTMLRTVVSVAVAPLIAMEAQGKPDRSSTPS